LYRKVCADADAGAVAEGLIREAVDGFRVGKAGRIEAVRVGPQSMMAVQRIDRQDYRVAVADLAPRRRIRSLRRA